jgi:hypothetical protein
MAESHESSLEDGTLTPELLAAQPAYKAELLAPVVHESYFGGEVRVIEAVPKNPHTNEPIETGAPDVYYAHGAGWAQEEPTILHMAQLGRRAFAMELTGDRESDPRFVTGHTPEGLVDATGKDVAAQLDDLGMVVPRQQMREAATLLGLIAERGAQDPAAIRIDAVFQSESAGHGLIAAYSHPEAFHNIVLAFPGSLSGPQIGFIPLRVAQDAIVRRQHRTTPDNNFRPPSNLRPGEALRMQLQSPGFKEDAAALRFSALANMLHAIRERRDAPRIGITLVAGLDDKIFELEKYLTSLVAPTDVDRIIVVPGAHAISGRKDVLTTVMDQFPAMEDQTDTHNALPLRERMVLPPDIPPEREEWLLLLADAVDDKIN